MEMRKEQCEEFKQGGEVVNKEFNKLKDFILETKHGVILVDNKLKETRFKKNEINNLFYLINENNLVNVKYISHELNMFLIAEIKVTTIDSKEYLIQLDKHYKLY
jgi:hypothetical protein